MFTGFSDATIDFLWELRFHNERPWFLEHKQVFLDTLDRPMKALAADVTAALEQAYPDRKWYLHVARIYRDARRLHGNGPYKENLWFTLRCDSSRGPEIPAFYFEITPHNYSYGMGFYWAKANTMACFRRAIDADPLPLTALAERLNAQDTFVLTGQDYARAKGDPGALLERECARNADLVRRCRTARDVRAAWAAGKTAALLGIEGAELLECDPRRLDDAAAWECVYVTLTWNHANALAGSHCDAQAQGLTAQGRDFVRALYAHQMLPDVSHLSEAAAWDVVRLGLGPVIASHANSRAVCAHTRNLSDDLFRAIRDSGGVVGLNLYTDFLGGGGMDTVVRHVEHLLDLGGDRTLALGGDLDGCDTLGGGITGVQDYPKLYAAIKARGYDAALLQDLFADNWLRVLPK